MRISALLACLVLGVGCTESVPDFGIDRQHPVVLESNPGVDSFGVDRDVSSRVTFSEAIDPSTVTNETFQLLLNGVPIAGTVTTTTTAATFAPAERLEDLTSYQILISSDVRDLAGLEMGTTFSAQYTTEDLQWEAPIEISASAPGGYFTGEASSGPNGSAIAVWTQDDAAVWAREIIDGVPQTAIQIDAGTDVGNAQVRLAGDGTALALWTKTTGGHRDLFWSSRNPISGIWASPSLLETDDTGNVGATDLSMNLEGFAVAVWSQSDTLSFPFRFNLYVRSYSPISGWGALTPLETRSETAQPPYVAVAANGSAVVNWSQSDGSGTRLWGSHSEIGDGWTLPAVLETSGNVEFGQPHIDDEGRAMVVWGAFNRFLPGIGWQGPRALPTGASFGMAALGGTGEGLISWQEMNAGRTEVRVVALSDDDVFGTPQLLASSDGQAFLSGCAIDDSGRSLALWTGEIVGRRSLLAARAVPNEDWSAPHLLENDNLGEVGATLSLSVAPGGEAIVLYTRNDGVLSRLWIAVLR